MPGVEKVWDKKNGRVGCGEEKGKFLINCISLASLWPNPPLVKHPFTIQNCGIENLVYHAFHSKITPALQARSCWDIFLISGDWRFYTKPIHHQTFLCRMSEKKKPVSSPIPVTVCFKCVFNCFAGCGDSWSSDNAA